MVQRGKFKQLRAIDISYTPALSENTIYQFLQIHGRQLMGLVLCGKPKLTENFWLNVIPYLQKIRWVGVRIKLNNNLRISETTTTTTKYCELVSLSPSTMLDPTASN
jgi:hypothetical protein